MTLGRRVSKSFMGFLRGVAVVGGFLFFPMGF